MEVTVTNYIKNPITAIETAACNCYDSAVTGGRIANACYKSGHHSVFEFSDFTFHVKGVSRALLAQITRHRLASFAVRSQRYCSEESFNYIIPDTIKNNEKALELYENFMKNCKSIYKFLQELDIPNEDARFVLPNACETEFELKMNGRELIHFFNERLCNRAQWEIRKLANKMIEALKSLNDSEINIFLKYCVPKCEAQGYNICPERKSCGRHKTLSEFNIEKVK